MRNILIFTKTEFICAVKDVFEALQAKQEPFTSKGFKDYKNKEFLNLKELCEYCNYKEETIYQYVNKKKIPYHKPGGKLLFKRTEIDKWLRTAPQRKRNK